MFFFFFNDTATTEIYTLSLHDALPICPVNYVAYARRIINAQHNGISIRVNLLIVFSSHPMPPLSTSNPCGSGDYTSKLVASRSEEHTSELQSRQYLVCRLLLEKKKHTV